MKKTPADRELEAAVATAGAEVATAAAAVAAALPTAAAAAAAVATAAAAVEAAAVAVVAALPTAPAAAAMAVAAAKAAVEATRDLEACLPAATAATAKSKAGKPKAAAEQKQAPAAKKVAEEEDPRLRWAFVRKIYGILTLQFVLTVAVAATAFLVRPNIRRCLADGSPAAVCSTFYVILVSPLIVMFPMLEYRETRPRNLDLLILFTFCCSSSIGVPVFEFTTADTAVLQVSILTVLGFTLFTIWSAKRGYNYNFSNTFVSLFFCLILVLAYIIVAIPFALKMVGIIICGLLASLLLSGILVVVRDAAEAAVIDA